LRATSEKANTKGKKKGLLYEAESSKRGGKGAHGPGLVALMEEGKKEGKVRAFQRENRKSTSRSFPRGRRKGREKTRRWWEGTRLVALEGRVVPFKREKALLLGRKKKSFCGKHRVGNELLSRGLKGSSESSKRGEFGCLPGKVEGEGIVFHVEKKEGGLCRPWSSKTKTGGEEEDRASSLAG